MIELWEHQQAACDKMAPLGVGAPLFDMGCGKTRAALALVEKWGCQRVLILCPKSVVPVWPGEFAKCGLPQFRTLALDGGTVAKRAQLISEAFNHPYAKGPLAVILNYEAAAHVPLGDAKVKGDAKRKWDPGLLRQLPWDCLICDESHMLKDPHGVQSSLVSRIASKVNHKLILTGTPMPHSPLDIFAQYRIADPTIFGWSYKDFEARYAVIEEHFVWCTNAQGAKFKRPYPKIVGYQNLDELQEKMFRIAHRVMADDVLDLPPAMDVERYCTLGAQGQKAYDAERGQYKKLIKGKQVTEENALVQGMRWSQITSGFLPVDEAHVVIGTEKCDMLEEFFGEVASDEPVVVFCRFTHDIENVKAVAKQCERTTCELSGKRNELKAWQNGEYNVLAVQLKAGGKGVDLTRARYQVFYSLDRDGGNWEQMRKRIHRPGQTRPVLYVNLLVKGTIDDVIYRALYEKRDVAAAIVDYARSQT
jgi:SNF2 family DNA or RNA helicase